ncbi:Putative electron transport protein YccM [Thermoflexales bacterium]|nr:Putative electron transport protein YccM [Thermoflexales bacterium]
MAANIIPLKLKSSARDYRKRIKWTQRSRRITQLAFAAYIISMSVVHNLSTVDGATPSIDALCPFGGIETLQRFLAGGGQFIPKTHLSNLVLLLGLTIGVVLAGGAFCGWVCPFGTLQDGLTGLRQKLQLKEVRVAPKLDRVLRYGRYLVLALILIQTISTVKLWFADFDPYRTIFGLGWLFEFNLETNWPAYTIALLIIGGSFLIERAWCRYLCPLGGAISLLGKLSFLRIRRTGESCKGCALCERPCPVKLPIATADTLSSNCIGCLECVAACPRHDTLEVRLAPVWLDPLKKRKCGEPQDASTLEVSDAR